MSDIKGLLDEPVGKRIIKGYLYCPNCGNYKHHPTRWCNKCGTELVREKKMPWREFLVKTRRAGAGPINTIQSILGVWKPDVKMVGVRKKVYDEANLIYSTGNTHPNKEKS